MDGFFKLGDDFTRPQTLAVVISPQHQIGDDIQEANVFLDCHANVWSQYFHRDVTTRELARRDGREMYLCDRRTRDRCQIEFGKGIVIAAVVVVAIDAVQGADDIVGAKWRHAILQRRQFGGDIGGNKIGPGGK